MDNLPVIGDNEVVRLSNDERLISLLYKHFNTKMRMKDVRKVLVILLTRELNHDMSKVLRNYDTFVKTHSSYIDLDTKKIRYDKFEMLTKLVDEHVRQIVTPDENDLEVQKKSEIIQLYYEDSFLNNTMSYIDVYKKLCDRHGLMKFKYPFENPDLEIKPLQPMQGTLQRIQIMVTAAPITFSLPIINTYECPTCNEVETRKAYETLSTNGAHECKGITADSEGKPKLCKKRLIPNELTSKYIDAYYNDALIDTTYKKMEQKRVISFNPLPPGTYDAVVVKLPTATKNMDSVVVLAHKEITPQHFEVPARVEGENYLFTLQKACDSYVEKHVGVKLYGLNQVKVAILMQFFYRFVQNDFLFHLQLVGEKATGKSTILKHYGIMLYGRYYMDAMGNSISIPALRGTQVSFTVFNQKLTALSPGLLGMYQFINIEEAGDRKELVQNLKGFMTSANYGNAMAGGTGVAGNKRVAQLALSENINNQHAIKYVSAVRNVYKADTTALSDYIKPDWDDSWNLFQPMQAYVDNPYLMKAIKKIRTDLTSKQMFWLDGYDIALHDRFIFYFYLTKDKQDVDMDEVVFINRNVEKAANVYEIMPQLYSADFMKYGEELGAAAKKIMLNKESFYRLLDILNESLDEFQAGDTRIREACHSILRISCAANNRTAPTEEDYNLVRWLMQSMYRKVTLNELKDYTVKAPLKKINKELVEQIDSTMSTDDLFGVKEDEFKV